ncbi:hypothetical protein GCM10009850_086740 [Nonomuraea monospora]|uniref:Transposase n=1 Tax=Nonomuraea monospora TaxID=568818 RepID=A0ABN3CUS8_9ACTN
MLRNETLALLELDGQWDDLLICGNATDLGRHTARGYRLGLSDEKRNAVQHAVPVNRKVSLCGEVVRPLPTLGWCLPFLPTATRACPACIRLSAQP